MAFHINHEFWAFIREFVTFIIDYNFSLQKTRIPCDQSIMLTIHFLFKRSNCSQDMNSKIILCSSDPWWFPLPPPPATIAHQNSLSGPSTHIIAYPWGRCIPSCIIAMRVIKLTCTILAAYTVEILIFLVQLNAESCPLQNSLNIPCLLFR